MQRDPHARPRYTEQLAAFCAGLRYEDIPRDVVDRTRLSILDSIGVMLAGSTTSLGAAARSSPTAAALINGTLLEVFELQGGWRLGNNHPCVVIPAALASSLGAIHGCRRSIPKGCWAGHPLQPTSVEYLRG